MAFEFLKVATDTEQFESLRSHLRTGRFWRLSSRAGTLTGAYLTAIAPSVNVLRALINEAFLAMIPGMSSATLAMWEKLCGTRIVADSLLLGQRQALLSFWLYGRHGAIEETIALLVEALGGTITWAPEYQSAYENWGMAFCVGKPNTSSEFGQRCTVGLPDSEKFGSLEFDWAAYVRRAKIEGFTDDTWSAFIVLEAKLRPAHLRIVYDRV